MNTLLQNALCATLLLAAACSGGDPNPPIRFHSAKSATGGTMGSTTGNGGGASGDGTDSKAQPAQANAAEKPSAFKGAPAYTSAPVDVSAASHHTTAGITTVPDGKVDCLSCHTGSPGPKFTFAGTVYQTSTGGPGAADVEVRVYDANGQALSVHTDADGNFWFPDDGTTVLATPAFVGARTAGGKQLMQGKVEGFACNSCHNSGLPIYQPAN